MVSPSIFTTLLKASSGVIQDCFVQNPPNEPQLMPLTYSACKQAILKIPVSDKAYAPIVFSRNPTAGFRLPYSWSHGGCIVIIDVTTTDAEETATFSEVFERAFELSIECVIRPPHLGGKCLLGTTDMLEITIIEPGVRKSAQGTKRSYRVLTEVTSWEHHSRQDCIAIISGLRMYKSSLFLVSLILRAIQ